LIITAERYHDISCGHAVTNHESKCHNLHGHNYRFHFMITGQKDTIGRIIDFSVIKKILCEWLEHEWDHRFLVYEKDNRAEYLKKIDDRVCIVPFNPTAENIAEYFMKNIAPSLLKETGARLIELKIEETRKCHARISIKS